MKQSSHLPKLVHSLLLPRENLHMALNPIFIRNVGVTVALKKPIPLLRTTVCGSSQDTPLANIRSFTNSSVFPTHSASTSSSTSNYISPFGAFFESIEKGQTTLNNNPTSNLSQQQTAIPVLKSGIPEHVLRFRTTCYPRLMLPPYTQNSEYKVTLKVSLRDIPLKSELEQQIFFQIVGSRYIVEKKELRLTSEKFASRIENKRYLCSVLDRIVLGAKRLAQEMEKGNVSTADAVADV